MLKVRQRQRELSVIFGLLKLVLLENKIYNQIKQQTNIVCPHIHILERNYLLRCENKNKIFHMTYIK